MTTIKFDKSVKYHGIRYAAHEAFKVEDSDVDELKKAGAIVLSADPVTPPQPEPEGDGEEDLEPGEGEEDLEPEGGDDIAKLKEELLSYTVAEMINFSKDRGIDLQGKTKKADIYNIIVAALD